MKFKRFRCLNEYLPLKQGLRPDSVVCVEHLIEVQLNEYLPLKQGLRPQDSLRNQLRYPQTQWVSSIKTRIKTGFQPHFAALHKTQWVSSIKTRIKTFLLHLGCDFRLHLNEYLPLKQGLRQAENSFHLLQSFNSMSIFH